MLGDLVMSAENVFDALIDHRLQSDFEREHGGFARRERRLPELQEVLVLLNVVVVARRSAGFVGLPRLLAEGDHGDAWRCDPRLLRCSGQRVNAPRVNCDGHSASGRHGIDEDQRV